MAHTPKMMSIDDVQDEVRYAWLNSYSPAATERALESIKDEPVPYKINHMASRLFFRGIYFPRKGIWQWLKLIGENRRPIFRIVREAFTQWHGTEDSVRRRMGLELYPGLAKTAPKESGGD
jgi:hypothetical protein